MSTSSEPRSGAEPQAVDVLFIGGSGRSGSTVLALLLGRLPGFVPVGGLTNLWERGLQKNYICGCGSHFRECPFWASVGEEAFGGWENLDADEILRLQHATTRYRHMLRLMGGRRSAYVENLTKYSSYVTSVYRAVTRVSGRSIVVDNSHGTPLGFFLGKAPGIRAHILHLVRDSRGVAYSGSKQMLRPEATTASPTYMERYSAAKAGKEWVLANLPYHAKWSSSVPRIRIYYESLVASPTTEIARIAEFLGSKATPSELSIFADDSIDIAENHMMSGNPHRLGRGQIQLRLDDEWRTKMRPTDRTVVTLLTSPLTLAYGYLGGRRSRQATSGSKVQSV